MDEFSFSQHQRLYFIDFRLMFVGSFSRSEVVQHFKLGLSAATRDINLYKELASQNLRYDNADKRYFKTADFKPLFSHDKESVLTRLSSAQSDQTNIIYGIDLPFEAPSQLVIPDVNLLAVLTQATLNNKAVDIEYVSLSSDQRQRTIVPHSIVDNGLRWHARAFDFDSNEFKDFVITRVINARLSDKEITKVQKVESDQQWNQQVVLELIPHPNNITYPQAIELDYGMTDGVLRLETRAALTGYILRRWNVDCSESASNRSPEHQLWLRNRKQLSAITNIYLTSGYKVLNPNQTVKQEPYVD